MEREREGGSEQAMREQQGICPCVIDRDETREKGGGRERKRERTQERKRKVKVKLRERKELGAIQGDQEIERASGGVICIKRYPWRYPYATPLSLTLFCRSSFAPADISFAAIFTNPCSLASISADDP